MKNPQSKKAPYRAVQIPAVIKKIYIKKKWLKVVEFAIVGFALWLNPSASLLIFLLKLCFQILHTLQKDEKQ